MIHLVIAKGSQPSGTVLARAIQNAGGTITKTAAHRVSYGVHLEGANIPTLNAKAGAKDKYEQLLQMAENGIYVPATFTPDTAASATFPLLARQRKHHGGKDIIPVLQAEEIPWRNAVADYYVAYIPWIAEYRVWIYRDNHLGTYQKTMAHPELFKRIGFNNQNGFAFQLVKKEQLPDDTIAVGRAAVHALQLDFGAVDIIHAKDGRNYVLEVNTAPGLEHEDKQAPRNLAAHIVEWAKRE